MRSHMGACHMPHAACGPANCTINKRIWQAVPMHRAHAHLPVQHGMPLAACASPPACIILHALHTQATAAAAHRAWCWPKPPPPPFPPPRTQQGTSPSQASIVVLHMHATVAAANSAWCAPRPRPPLGALHGQHGMPPAWARSSAPPYPAPSPGPGHLHPTEYAATAASQQRLAQSATMLPAPPHATHGSPQHRRKRVWVWVRMARWGCGCGGPPHEP